MTVNGETRSQALTRRGHAIVAMAPAGPTELI